MKIVVESLVKADQEATWTSWNTPEHIMSWNFATEDWHCPKSEVDLQVGGKFTTRMAAKDGSFEFDFSGTYTQVDPFSLVKFQLDDGREVVVEFIESPQGTLVRETFDAEEQNDPEMQKGGWQAILDNFAKYTSAMTGV